MEDYQRLAYAASSSSSSSSQLPDSSVVIRPLTEELRDRLRSEITITSASQCVEELVCNSIDAEATCVSVTFDPISFKVKVEDNGKGMRRADMALLGRRHHTSKCHSLQVGRGNMKT